MPKQSTELMIKHTADLIVSCINNNFNDAKNAIERGANVNMRLAQHLNPEMLGYPPYTNEPAIVYALNKGKEKIVELLLENNANFESRDNRGRTPLMIAASHNFLEGVQMLYTIGANINAHNTNKMDEYRSVINWGVYSHSIQMIELLIKLGAKVNESVLECVQKEIKSNPTKMELKTIYEILCNRVR